MRGKPSEEDPLLSLHTFSLEGYHYAVQGSSGFPFELDGPVSRALAELREAAAGPGPVPGRWPPSSVSPALLAELEKVRERALRYAEGGKRLRWQEAHQRSPRSIELCLCATFRCNLACRYCFVRLSSGDRRDAKADMTFETARAAIEFALGKLESPTRELVVSFGHTGEPLLAKELYEKIGSYAQRREAETGRRIAYGMAATNLTLARSGKLPKLSWPTISLDGPREVHDRCRTTPAGLGTYDAVVSSLKMLLATASAEAAGTNVVATVTARSTDIKAIFLHLASLGAPFVSLYPVRLPPGSELAITEAAASELLAGYDDLLRHLLTVDGTRLLQYLKCMVHSQDYFGRHLLRVAGNHRVRRRCDAGVGMLAVTPDGELFPCPELAALGRMGMGSIQEGLDEQVVTYLESRNVWDLETCAACWARLLCGGDCLSNRAMYEPFGAPPDPGMCAFTRGLVERAIHLVARLREAHPEVLSAVLQSRARWLTDTEPAGADVEPPSDNGD